MYLRTITILTIFVFTSCHAVTDNNSKSTLSSYNTDNVVVKKTVMATGTTTGSFVATLKDGIKKTNATINNTTIFTPTIGQLFVYENYSHNAWIADGRSAYIPPDQVVKVDTTYFKFNFSKWNFVKDKEYELTIAAKSTGVDLNLLIKKIRIKEGKALRIFFALRKIIDGAAAEEFYSDFWALINLWTDSELSNFVQSLKTKDRMEFSNIMLENAPLSNVTVYYKIYYPHTFRELKIGE